MTEEGPETGRVDSQRAPAAVAEPETTGHTAVDGALARLNHLPERPVVEHVAEFDAIHEVLREALAAASHEDHVR